MIYQEMYGYLTIEDPQEQKKVWPLLSPQVRDYVNIFLSLMKQAPENIYYQKSKFYRLITEEEFENLRLVYFVMQAKEVVIDLAFEEEFKQAFVAYEKKSAMKSKMNRWRREMKARERVLENTEFKGSRRQMVESDSMLESERMTVPHAAKKSSKISMGWLVALLLGALILLAIYFVWK
ncbi:hypothetical protein U0R10_00395 [Aquirufa sp. OSTEICH-129V]|uniref:Uncharacterized protein n=1 Tax=Aquirufa avitistagni TaxID=3104728 RepID=A0ABW6D816_9BACT